MRISNQPRILGDAIIFGAPQWGYTLTDHPDPEREAPWDTTGPGGHAIEDAGTGIEVWSLPEERSGPATLARTIPYGQARATPTWLALDGTTAIEGHGATVRMWDVTTGQQVSAHTVSGPITQVSRVDGVAMVSYGHHVTGIDIETRSEVFSWDLGDILQTGDTLRQFAMVDGTYYASLETNTGGAFIELNTGSGASVVRASMSTATGSVAFNDARMRGETTTERLVVPGVLTADIQRGVQVGVGTPVLEHPAPAEYPDDGAHFTPISEQMAVEPGATYIARLRLERTPDFEGEGLNVSLVASWNEDNHVQIASLESLPLYGDGEVRDFSIVPPPTTGMWDTVRLQLDRTPGYPGRVRVSDLQILERARGDVSVDGQVDAQVGTFARLEINEINTGVMRLDSIIMSGNLRANGDTLTIPEHLRGTFRKYEIQITGGTDVPSNGARPLCIYVNDDKSSWRGAANAWNSDGSHRAGTSYDNATFPLSAYVGQWESSATLQFYPSGLGNVAVVNMEASGWGNNGVSGGFNWRAGARWLPGGLQPINHFLIDTNNTGVAWNVTGRATLWGYR